MQAHPNLQDENWICPFCQKNDNDFLPEKLQFHCGRCHALGKHLSFVKQVLSNEAFTNLNRVLSGATVPHSAAACPDCRQPLSFFRIPSTNRKTEIAACVPCRWVWSDAIDFLHAFANTAPGVIERAAINIVNGEREEPIKGVIDDAWDHSRLSYTATNRVEETVNEVVGPIAQHDLPLTAYYSFKIVAACAIVTFLAWKLPRLLPYFVFDPRDPLRLAGLPVFLSGFMHANFMHLLGNGIAILTTGWILENELKRPRNVLWIFLGSVLLGNLFHAFFAAPASVVGASGGARGLLAFYCIMFPWASFTFSRRISAEGRFHAIFKVAAPAYLTGIMLLDFLGGWTASQIHQNHLAHQNLALPLAENVKLVLVATLFYLQYLTPGWQAIASYAHFGGAVFGLLYAIAVNCEVNREALSVSTKAPSRKRDGSRRNPIPSKKISGFPNGIGPGEDHLKVYSPPVRKEKV